MVTTTPHLEPRRTVPRIEALTVKNYRALANLTLREMQPLTVLLGPNGSGKSTVFDVFAFLSECFSDGLRRAWDRRGRFRELRTRGQDGPIVIELKYRERPKSPIITYHLEIDEGNTGPFLSAEWLQWRRGSSGKPFRFLNFKNGRGEVIEGEVPDEDATRIEEGLESPEVLAVNALGQLSRHPRVASLRRFITGWHLSYLSGDSTRGVPEAGPQEHLSQSGDNLPNVVQFLKEQHPERLDQILTALSRRVPQLESVETTIMENGHLLLRFKDSPFEQPILSRYASDGSLKMLAYLILLHDPAPAPLMGIEEPENFLHPRLLAGLAEECRKAAERSQLLVTSHSPFLVNGLRSREVWVLYRDTRGLTQARRTDTMRGIPEFIEAGALLGDLWMEGHFEAGDPLVRAGRPEEAKRQGIAS
jgi:predicted ATPase